jgi:hypothetical protein
LQRRYTNFDELSLAGILGDRVRSQRDITEPLPPRWLELLTQLARVITEAPPTQPEQGEHADAHREETATTEPASLMKQLAQLDPR